MITIVDYGMGNLGSIKNMLKKIGVPALISSDPTDIKAAEKLILPGVGAFENGMKNLNERGLIDILNEKVRIEKTPVLGICLGMQLLSNSSQEGTLHGLGWLDAATKKFDFTDLHNPALKIPHMGWNTVEIKKNHALFANMPPEIRFYFVHSYYVDCKNPDHELTHTVHGITFTSAVAVENICGVQFHPEKSHKFGMKLLANFAATSFS